MPGRRASRRGSARRKVQLGDGAARRGGSEEDEKETREGNTAFPSGDCSVNFMPFPAPTVSEIEMTYIGNRESQENGRKQNKFDDDDDDDDDGDSG